MTFWIVTALVVLGFAAFAWWSSGRSAPLGRRREQQQLTAAQEDHMTRSNGGGWGAGSVG